VTFNSARVKRKLHSSKGWLQSDDEKDRQLQTKFDQLNSLLKL